MLSKLCVVGVVSLLETSAIAAPGDAVQLTDSSGVTGCERITDVKGSSAWGGMLTNMAYNRALNQLKARAAQAGGTHLVLLNASSGFTGSNMLGVAYRCPAKPSARDPAPAAATNPSAN